MLHLTKKWVRQNLDNSGFSAGFIKAEFSYKSSHSSHISGMISTDKPFGCSYVTKDGRHWFMFSVYKLSSNYHPVKYEAGHHWILILHDADDFFVYRLFSNKSSVYDWLYMYFKQELTEDHIDNNYTFL